MSRIVHWTVRRRATGAAEGQRLDEAAAGPMAASDTAGQPVPASGRAKTPGPDALRRCGRFLLLACVGSRTANYSYKLAAVQRPGRAAPKTRVRVCIAQRHSRCARILAGWLAVIRTDSCPRQRPARRKQTPRASRCDPAASLRCRARASIRRRGTMGQTGSDAANRRARDGCELSTPVQSARSGVNSGPWLAAVSSGCAAVAFGNGRRPCRDPRTQAADGVERGYSARRPTWSNYA